MKNRLANFFRCLFSNDRSAGVTLTIIVCFFIAKPGFCADLAIESTVDGTPSELRQLASRAAALDSRVKELEQRISEAQMNLIGDPSAETVEYRLELKPSTTNNSASDKNSFAVSHVRVSLDGRPFIYTQSAVVVSEKNPLPLFLGRMREGQHLVRLQFQMSPLPAALSRVSEAPWRTVDKTLALEINAKAGRKQNHFIEIKDPTQDVDAAIRTSSSNEQRSEVTPRILEKAKEAL
ncbi:hypothetical protein EBU99_00705 [bacterium]|nr:hypothetical protein [bacterium]